MRDPRIEFLRKQLYFVVIIIVIIIIIVLMFHDTFVV